MKKHIKGLALLLIVIFSVTAFVACDNSTGGKTEESGVVVWSAVNTEKIMQDAEIGSGKCEITFNTFKGDVESAQILFTPKQNVSSFNFEMGDVTNAVGDKLSANLFEVFAQRYVNVSIPSSTDCYTGYYPDALVPIRNYCLKEDNNVAKNCNQGIWINLNVPKDAKAGTYVGNATLTVDDEKITIPVTVKVFNVDMPEEIHTVSSFYLERSMIGVGGEGALTKELDETYYNFFVKKRANLRDIPTYSINRRWNVESFANDVVSYVKNPMVSAYALPYASDGDRLVDYEYCLQLLTALANKNKQLLDSGDNVDLFKKAHYYLGALIDEPTQNSYDRVRECDLRIHKAKLAVAGSGVLDNYPQVKNSLLSLRHVVTSRINEQLFGTDEVGGVQTWCPLIDRFAGVNDRELALERMNSTDRTGGENVWWYTCCNPKNPYPSYQTDENLLVARLRGWMEYEYKIQGFLYWSVNNWQWYNQGQYVADSDIWADARSWEGANGDGRLCYPGSKYGIKGPISTIRLENIRESNEDYELLWIFEQTINALNKQYNKSYDSDKLLGKFFDRLIDSLFAKQGLTEVDFDGIRVELLELVDTMVNNPNSAIAQLDVL